MISCFYCSREVDDNSDESDRDITEQCSDTLGAAIMYEFNKMTGEAASSSQALTDESCEIKRKKYQKDSYFSDEEELE